MQKQNLHRLHLHHYSSTDYHAYYNKSTSRKTAFIVFKLIVNTFIPLLTLAGASSTCFMIFLSKVAAYRSEEGHLIVIRNHLLSSY